MVQIIDKRHRAALFRDRLGKANTLKSLGVGRASRRKREEMLVDAGLPPGRMMPGTGCCALTDSVELTRRAVELGLDGVKGLSCSLADVNADGRPDVRGLCAHPNERVQKALQNQGVRLS